MSTWRPGPSCESQRRHKIFSPPVDCEREGWARLPGSARSSNKTISFNIHSQARTELGVPSHRPCLQLDIYWCSVCMRWPQYPVARQRSWPGNIVTSWSPSHTFVCSCNQLVQIHPQKAALCADGAEMKQSSRYERGQEEVFVPGNPGRELRQPCWRGVIQTRCC